MKEKRWANLFIITGFLAFLSLALVVTLMRPKTSYSYYENRSLARPTPLNVQTILDGSFAQCVEPVLQDHAAGRNMLLKAATWSDLHLFHRPVINQVIPTPEMLLSWNPYETPDPTVISTQAQHMADQLAALRDVAASYGGQFYYVSVPGQYAYFEEQHPDFLNNRAAYTQLELPAFIGAMEERGVPLIEMGAVLDKLGNPPELYSTVDYHYQFGGAYVTYRAIMDRVNPDFGGALKVLTQDDLEFQTLENPYLGSRSRKLFGLWDSGERLTVAYPLNPTPFTRTDNGQPMPEAVYSLPENPDEPVLYSAYMGGDVGETVIQTNRPHLPSILIYGDSFTNPVECLMYESFDEMRSIDLRHYKERTLAEYIQLYQPDIVVGIRDYEALLSTDFNGSPFQVQP